MEKRPPKVHAEVRYPAGFFFTPRDWLRFIETKTFSQDRERLGLDDNDVNAIQVLIMLDPDGHPLIQGTGGLRKLRFAKHGSGKGKSGGLRVCYVYFEASSIVALITAYGKNEADNIDPADKKLFKAIIERFGRAIDDGIFDRARNKKESEHHGKGEKEEPGGSPDPRGPDRTG